MKAQRRQSTQVGSSLWTRKRSARHGSWRPVLLAVAASLVGVSCAGSTGGAAPAAQTPEEPAAPESVDDEERAESTDATETAAYDGVAEPAPGDVDEGGDASSPAADPAAEIDPSLPEDLRSAIRACASNNPSVQSEDCVGILRDERIPLADLTVEAMVDQLEERCRRIEAAPDAVACLGVADLHDTGIRVGQDNLTSVDYYAYACELDDALGCLGQGRNERAIAYASMGGPDAAVEAFRKACDLGALAGCTAIGDLRFADAKAAADYAERESDDPSALEEASTAWEAAETAYLEACEPSDSAAEADGDACAALGRVHEVGVPGLVKASPRRARKRYDRGCELGSGEACAKKAELAVARKKGWGGGAREAWQRGCVELQSPVACESYARALILDDHLKPEPDVAVPLLEAACADRQGGSCIALGEAYLAGTASSDGKPDAAAAREPLQRACRELYDPSGCTALGAALDALGEVEAARMAWDDACFDGQEAACEMLRASKERAVD